MTVDKFRNNFLKFLEYSNVNLGRKTSKTRQDFLNEARNRFDRFIEDQAKIKLKQEKECEKKEKIKTSPMEGSVLRIKPKDSRNALDVGKGVHAMTSIASQEADEQLGRSPFGTKRKEK